jgi:hypothetical protein
MSENSPIFNAYNLATNNKWILSLPYKIIEPTMDYKDAKFNLVAYTPSAMTVSNTSLGFQGISIPIATGVRAEDKTVTFKYNMSSDYSQYKFLYKWFSMASNEDSQMEKTLKDRVLDITVYGLSEFKTPVIGFRYQGAWILSLGALDYGVDPNNIVHSFTLKYTKFHLLEDSELPVEGEL